MQFTAFITKDAIQFNLKPENSHEEELVKTLAKYRGPVEIFQGVSIAECGGGYIRNFGESDKHIAIKINASPPEAQAHPDPPAIGLKA